MQLIPVPDAKAGQLREAFLAIADFEELPKDAPLKESVGVHGHLLIELPDGTRLLARGRPPVTLGRYINCS